LVGGVAALWSVVLLRFGWWCRCALVISTAVLWLVVSLRFGWWSVQVVVVLDWALSVNINVRQDLSHRQIFPKTIDQRP
jgi:hypothetical protein